MSAHTDRCLTIKKCSQMRMRISQSLSRFWCASGVLFYCTHIALVAMCSAVRECGNTQSSPKHTCIFAHNGFVPAETCLQASNHMHDLGEQPPAHSRPAGSPGRMLALPMTRDLHQRKHVHAGGQSRITGPQMPCSMIYDIRA